MQKQISVVLLACFALLMPIAAQDQSADRGTVSGFVINVSSGALVSGASLEVISLGVEAVADMDGAFSLELPAGKYDFKVVVDGFLEQIVKGVEVKAGETTFQDIAMTPENLSLGEVTVVAEASKASVEALLAERKGLAAFSDSIGTQEMSRLTGSDAADVMSRVTGVSVVDNKFIYVRGLGERYSNTMLNNSVIPSTQPDKKVVAMDMFPASLLENVRTDKSYTPDQPGEFSGGLVRVQTKDFPRVPTAKLSFKQGFGTNTTFRDFWDYSGGSYDFLGFDNGIRQLPSIIPQERLKRSSRFDPAGFEPEELQEFGRSFYNTWTPRVFGSAPPNTGFNFVAGNTFGKLGTVFAFNYGNDFHNQNEVRNFYLLGGGDELERFGDYDFEYSSFSVRTGLTANMAYELTDSNRLIFRNFVSRDTSDEARWFEGEDLDQSRYLRNQRIRYSEEALYSGQLVGEHNLGLFGNSFIEWRVTYTNSSLDNPDMREVLYEERNGKFYYSNESQSGFRMFTDQNEETWEPAFDWTTVFSKGAVAGSFKFGALYRSRERDFLSRRFRFFPRRNVGRLDLSQSAEDLFAIDNINPDTWELTETTRPTDAYDGKKINRAAYGMLDVSFSRWRLIGGLRVESDGQRVETFNPFDPSDQDSVTAARLENTDLLGSAGAIFRLNSEMNLRGSFSRTLNRPEFRELSPFEFTDVVGGAAIIGNPDLVRASINNYDARWEWYSEADELVSVSFFYKTFDKPIERFVEPTSTLRFSYLNAEEARNAGVEFDFRKGLGFLGSGFEWFSVNANYTFVDSDVTIPPAETNVLTSLRRPLAGQSRHVLNGIVQFEHPGTRSLTRVLYNYQGARITEVGALGLPDILQSAMPRLDALYSQPIGSRFGLKFTAENLLDPSYEYTQGGEIWRAYKIGRKFAVSLSYSFFDE